MLKIAHSKSPFQLMLKFHSLFFSNRKSSAIFLTHTYLYLPDINSAHIPFATQTVKEITNLYKLSQRFQKVLLW